MLNRALVHAVGLVDLGPAGVADAADEFEMVLSNGGSWLSETCGFSRILFSTIFLKVVYRTSELNACEWFEKLAEKMPFGGFTPNLLNASGCLSGHSTASISSCFTV